MLADFDSAQQHIPFVQVHRAYESKKCAAFAILEILLSTTCAALWRQLPFPFLAVLRRPRLG